MFSLFYRQMSSMLLFEPFGLAFQTSGWEMSLGPSSWTLTGGMLYFLAWPSIRELAKDSSRQDLKLTTGKELCKLNGWTSFVDRIGGGVTGLVGSFR